jgi:hypothetical protein
VITVALALVSGTTLVAAARLRAARGTSSSSAIVFKGVATVREWYYDYCDLTTTARRLYDQAQGTFAVTLVMSRPLASGGRREPNPFHFSLATNRQGGDGTFGLVSAAVPTTASGRRVLLTYWRHVYNRRTGRVIGQLVASHRAEGAAANLLFTAPSGRPCDVLQPAQPFGDGERGFATSLRGTITARRARLVLKGSTWNGNRDVVVTATLHRR